MLQQRAAREASAEQALAMARREYDRRLALLEETRGRLEAVTSAVEKNGLDLFDEMHLAFYRMSLRKQAGIQERAVENAGRIVENRRSEAVRARQERQVLEKLKDKHLQDYRREAAAREQKLVDEMALYTHLRRLKELPAHHSPSP